MKKYLLDSNILSEPSKPVPHESVVSLLKKNRKDSAVSVLSYFEMLHGVLALPDGKRKERLMAYLEETVVPFYDFLAFDFACANARAAEICEGKQVIGNVISVI